MLFPWGSLLRGVTLPEPGVLAALARIASPRARLDIVINRSAEQTSLDGLAERYAAAGITIDRIERTQDVPYTTTWGKRVAFRSDVLRVQARIGV